MPRRQQILGIITATPIEAAIDLIKAYVTAQEEALTASWFCIHAACEATPSPGRSNLH